MTSIVTGQHRLDPLASIVLLISSCEQVCNVSQFASVPEGKLRIHDGDNDDDDDEWWRLRRISLDLFHDDKEERIS